MKKFFLYYVFFIASPTIYAFPLKSFLFAGSSLAALSIYKKPIRVSKPLAYLLEQLNDKAGLSFQNKYEKITYGLLQRFPELSAAFLVYALENSMDTNKTSIFDERFIEKYKRYIFSSDYRVHIAEIYAKHIITIPKSKLEECYELSNIFDAETSLDTYYIRGLFRRAAEKNLTSISLYLLSIF